MIVKIKNKSGNIDVWEWKEKEATGRLKEDGITTVYEATMIKGASAGLQNQFPIRSTKDGLPAISMEHCANIFILTEYGEYYTKSKSCVII